MPVPDDSYSDEVKDFERQVEEAKGIARTVSDWLDRIFGGRFRSACDTVNPNDVDGFVAGRLAPWKVHQTKALVAEAFGEPPTISYEELGISFQEMALIHIRYYVPFCRSLERDRLTNDLNSPATREFVAATKAEWVRVVRSGHFPISRQSEQRRHDGGDMPADNPYGDPGVIQPGGGAPIVETARKNPALVLGAVALLLTMKS